MAQQAIELFKDPATQDLLKSITGEVADYASQKDFSAVDKLLAQGKISPAVHLTSSLVHSAVNYMQKSQENEAALIEMIKTLSVNIIASSQNVVAQVIELGEKRTQLVLDINKQCSDLVAKAMADSQEKIIKIKSEAVDKDILEILKDDPTNRLEYMKGIMTLNIAAINAIKDSQAATAKTAEKNCKSLVKLTKQAIGGEQKFYDNLIVFYTGMMTKAQDTLEKTRESNQGMANQIITGTFDLLKARKQLDSAKTPDNSQTPTVTSATTSKTAFWDSPVTTTGSVIVEELNDQTQGLTAKK